MPSIKQIGTICFALSFIIFPKFTFADNEPTVIPTPANCNEAVLNTTEGSADLEAIYTANTINTTWFSNGTQLSGNGVPATCTYNTPILPPTPENRPGYVFNGWKLKRCEVPGTLVSTNGSSRYAYGWSRGAGFCYVNNRGSEDNCSDANFSDMTVYEWKVKWANGDAVIGESVLTNNAGVQGYIGTPDTSTSGGKCWCRAKSYIQNGSELCNFVSASWVFCGDNSSSGCASCCAMYVQSDIYNANFRQTVFTGLVAQ